jgi:hypothetical protein
MTKEEFLAAWRAMAPKPTLEPELLALTPRQRADVMVDVKRVSMREVRALMRKHGMKLTQLTISEMVTVARYYEAGFRGQLIREAIENLSRGYWAEQKSRHSHKARRPDLQGFRCAEIQFKIRARNDRRLCEGVN